CGAVSEDDGWVFVLEFRTIMVPSDISQVMGRSSNIVNSPLSKDTFLISTVILVRARSLPLSTNGIPLWFCMDCMISTKGASVAFKEMCCANPLAVSLKTLNTIRKIVSFIWITQYLILEKAGLPP